MNVDVVNLIQAIIRDQLRAFKTSELGIVTKVYSHESGSDKNNCECDVRLRDSELELKRVPVSTQRVGAVAIPNKDDLVLVHYLNGDIHSALIIGRLYNDQDRSPKAKPREWVYISPDAAESGIRRMFFQFPNGNQFLLDDDKLVLEMGKTKLTINHGGDVIINSDRSNITLTDQGGNNALDIQVGQGQVSLKGQTKVIVDAPQIELVQSATHPLVYGDQLLQYLTQVVSIFQSHVHAGQMAGPIPVTPAPPVPPMPAPTPTLLSMKVKTG